MRPQYDYECDDCYVLCKIAGQAITRYTCCDCNEIKLWANTGVPMRCRACAQLNNKCHRCENETN